ncbi:MAG: hypothetical protein GX794_04780 [Acholeplasmataceae bacterium]|jgi:hypothetical protein|nr:hypothetical protein [Acholeplasmataceae bacterium]
MDALYIIIGILIIVVLTVGYILSVRANHKTPAPKGCELAFLEAKCETCLSTNCSVGKEIE